MHAMILLQSRRTSDAGEVTIRQHTEGRYVQKTQAGEISPVTKTGQPSIIVLC